MVERRAADLKILLVEHDAFRMVRQGRAAPHEGVAGVKLGGFDHLPAIELLSRDDEVGLILGNEVPGISTELVLDAVDEARRAGEVERGRTAETQAKQAVEAIEVIDMGVRDEDMGTRSSLRGGTG